MSFRERIVLGIGLTILLSIFVLYVVIASMQSVSKETSGTTETAGQQPVEKQSFSSWIVSRIPLLPWQAKEQQLFAVMVENHQVARPYHAGLEKALFVQEFYVEGYISRFVALFTVDDIPEVVGPVRSLRPYFIQAFLPWTPFVFHAGGSPEALERVQNAADIYNYNALSLEEAFFDRKAGVPAPHDLFLPAEDTSVLLEKQLATYSRKVRLPLYPTGRALRGSGATNISINFYSPVHNVQYIYNQKIQAYQRINGSVISLAAPKNVVVVAMKTKEDGTLGRLAIESIGKGDALLFRSGKVYQGTWQRESETEPYIFLGADGELMRFAAGQIWLTGVNSTSRVRWE